VAQHQSQCSIFANQQLKVSKVFLFVLFSDDCYLPFIPLRGVYSDTTQLN